MSICGVVGVLVEILVVGFTAHPGVLAEQPARFGIYHQEQLITLWLVALVLLVHLIQVQRAVVHQLHLTGLITDMVVVQVDTAVFSCHQVYRKLQLY
jgi:hypothetical protein